MTRRGFRVAAAVGLVAALSACTSTPAGPGPGTSSPPVVAAPVSPGVSVSPSTSPTATTTPTATPATASPTGSGPAVLRLAAGVEQDACGIGVVLVFIPASALSPKLDYPVLVGGPVGHVDAAFGDRTGSDPLPADAAHLAHGVVVRVAGHRFGVNEIDVAGKSAVVTPLC